MWNRRDLLTLSSAALATFAITLALSLPRLAHAVDQQPPATTDIKLPTLTLDSGTVSAALDKTNPHTLILTLRNTSASDAQLKFSTSVGVSQPTPLLSRVPEMSHDIWRQEISQNVDAGQTREISVLLPDAAFEQPDTKPVDPQRMSPGRAVIFLMRPNGMIITALTLWTGKTAEAPAPIPVLLPSPLPAPALAAKSEP